MTLAQLDVGAFGSPDGPGGDRVPPQDVHAEQSVLGGMLLSKDAIGDVAEELKSTDFYRPAHELIYDAIIDLFSRGEPVDAITVADEMTKRGTLQRAGGQAYLHDLIQAVPTAANAGYYAQIVAERALLRRLVEAGTKIVQLGYGQGEGDVEEIVNRAQAEVYAVADKRGSEDYVRLGLTLEDTLNEIEVASGRTDEMTGVPTGFTELDELLHGLHRGQMIVVAARPAVGKALALDTPLPTPTGWTTMGEVAVGDLVLGADGRPTRITQATAVMTGRPCFEVVFSDGATIVADAEHQWVTHTRASRRSAHRVPAVRTTEEIAATLRTQTPEARLNHSVSLAEPLELPDVELPLSPYAIGAWLGDGTSAEPTITTADPEIVAFLEGEGLEVTPTAGLMRYRLRLPRSVLASRSCVVCGTTFVPATSQVKTCGRSCGGKSRGTSRLVPTCPDCGVVTSGHERCQACRNDHGTVKGLLRGLDLLGNKHIPAALLRGSVRQRRDLLAGLLDTDGTVTSSGCVQFTTTSQRLAADFAELIASLGMRVGISRKRVIGRTEASSTVTTLTFSTDEDVFWLPRKAIRHKELRKRTFQRRDSRFITAVRPIASIPVRCIEVDNADHVYLAGREMVPTHNSTFGMDIARTASIKHNLPAAFFSLEMSRTEISMRVLAAEGSMSMQDLRKGTIGDAGWQKLAKVVTRIEHAPLYIDDSPNMSLMEIRAKCRRLKQQHGLKLVVIDYLQLMSSGKKVESRQQEVSEFSRALKLLAKELEVPVIAISQLNRGPEQRTDKRPQMSDLRESGSIEQDADVVILLHKEKEREGEADVLVVKHRNGPTRDITLGFQGHYSRFSNMATNAGF
ncbi:replicative DNA helicase [Nostocoides australiense]